MSTDPIITILSSAAIGSLVAGLFELIKSAMQYNREKNKRNSKAEERYKLHKEEAYLAALDRLLQVRNAFDYTSEDLVHSKQLRQEIEEQNRIFRESASKIRMYSSDEIFNLYYQLMQYSRFAYAPLNGPRLIENSKWGFDVQVVRLARMMQEDLGYRQFSKLGNEKVECPDCGMSHDAYSSCPKCGMPRNVFEEKLRQINRDMEEYYNHESFKEDERQDVKSPTSTSADT